jgi:hypothetical protein
LGMLHYRNVIDTDLLTSLKMRVEEIEAAR